MTRTPTTRSIAVLASVAVALTLAACGDDDDDGSTATSAPGSAPTTPSRGDTTTPTSGATPASGSAPAAAVDLAAVCPDPIVIQTDWFPEAEHGALYELVGEGYTVDAGSKVVRGPLVAGGQDTGVAIEVRTGGPAIGFQPVSVRMYADDTITLGYANTEGQIQRCRRHPGARRRRPARDQPADHLLGSRDLPGHPDPRRPRRGGRDDQHLLRWDVRPTCSSPRGSGPPTRSMSRTTAARRASSPRTAKIAQQGFASAEPYTYENLSEEWGKPVAYQTLHDAGFEVYSQMLAIVPDKLEELRPCLERFVPVVQQAAIDYIEAPDRANAIIVDAVDQYDDFWVYDEGLADFSVTTQRDLGFVGNGPDDTLGNMDEARVQGVIDQIRDAGIKVPADLTVGRPRDQRVHRPRHRAGRLTRT